LSRFATESGRGELDGVVARVLQCEEKEEVVVAAAAEVGGSR
jgi:hypothetical protein